VNPLTTDIGRGYNHISSGIGAVMIRWHSDPAKALR
jgi:thiamine biosynthesis protein ThiC